jgi:hypothetical protein
MRPAGGDYTDEYLGDQFPLSAADDYLIHQTTDPIRIVETSDLRAYERYWTAIHDDGGRFIVITGASMYPSLDLMESFAIVNLDGEHRSVRAFRRLGANRLDLAVGPLRPTILEGMRAWRYLLAENEWGISFDFEFRDVTRQFFRDARTKSGSGYPAGRRSDVTAGFEGFGAAEGWIEVHGQRVEFDAATCRGTRDRHWGVGRSIGSAAMQPPGSPEAHGVSGNTFVMFGDWGIWGDRIYYPMASNRRPGKIIQLNRRLRFDDANLFAAGIVDYTLATGEVMTVELTRLGHQIAFLRCGMYGGTPDKNIRQGEDVGELVEGDHYDVTDADTRRFVAGLDQHLCRVVCNGETTYGIYQPVEPDAFHACRDGRRGWTLLDG